MATEYKPVALPGGEDAVRIVDTETGAVLQVHPVAALFPMMTDEELADLAADIKANGQVHPIILDADDVLIDGRNRLKACEIAGIQPRYEVLPDGVDATAFILSLNVSRRHLTKGQQAMAVAQASDFLKISQRQIEQATGVGQSRVAYARAVIRYAPELIDAVMSAGLGLNEAYKQAQDRKAKADSVEARMERLRIEAPDLSDLVIEGRLEISDAIAALDKRQREAKEARETTTRNLSTALLYTDHGKMTPVQCAEQLRVTVDWTASPHGFALTPERLYRSVAVLEALAAQLEASTNGQA